MSEAQCRICAAEQAVALARDCLLDMARHFEELASELERALGIIDRCAEIEVHLPSGAGGPPRLSQAGDRRSGRTPCRGCLARLRYINARLWRLRCAGRLHTQTGATVLLQQELSNSPRAQIVELVARLARLALPAIYEWREFVDAGGLGVDAVPVRPVGTAAACTRL